MSQPCADCGRLMKVKGRGLCKTCYERHRHRGTLGQWPCGVIPEAKNARACVRCERRRAPCGRGLCYSCHQYLRKHGRLDDYPRKTWRRDELLAEWDHLRGGGVDITEAARRIGISRDGLKKAIERAGKRAA